MGGGFAGELCTNPRLRCASLCMNPRLPVWRSLHLKTITRDESQGVIATARPVVDANPILGISSLVSYGYGIYTQTVPIDRAQAVAAEIERRAVR